MTVTQLVNPEIDRVDAVNGPATGLPFLMFKSLEAPAEEAEAEVAKSAEDAPVVEVDVVKSADETETIVLKAEEAPAEEPAEEEVAKSEEAAPSMKELFEKAQAESKEDPAEEAGETKEEEALEETAKSELPPAPHPAAHAPAAPEKPLPSGLQEILDTFVESYSRFKEAQDSGAQAALVEDDLAAPAAPAAPAPVAPAAPAAPVACPDPTAHAAPAPAAHEAPAPAAHEAAPAAAPAAPEAPAPAVHHEAPPAAAEAPAAAEEDPAKKFAKSMDSLIAEAVAKAVAEAQEPLLKQIDALERTPVDSGPLLAGQTPANGGTPLLGRGQAEGVVTKGLGDQAVASQAAPGAYALAEALKGVHLGR